jgi:outer membrane protein assembly factor BamE (lipoprotein component of BamABCDE complex)
MNSLNHQESGVVVKSPRCLRLVALLAAVVIAGGLPGCVIMHTTSTAISGKNIAPNVFAQIVPGKSKAFVVGMLGEPTERIKEDADSDLWKWRYSEKHETTNAFIFFPLHQNNSVEQTHFVEFKDGVVVRAWAE